MPLTKLEHFLVLTADLQATKRFYCEALGMQEGFRPDLGFPGTWVYAGDTPCIHIAEWESYTAHSRKTGIGASVPAHSTGAVDHIAFTGEDYDEIVARLEKCGVNFSRNDRPGTGLRQLFLSDPNGVKIEINVRASQGVPPRD